MYQPSEEILKKYADILIKFAPHEGKGIKAGETICIQIHECAKPFLKHLQMAAIEAGANLIIDYMPDGIDKDFYLHASEEQITFVPKNMALGKLADTDYLLVIRSFADIHEMDEIDSNKIMKNLAARKFIADARHKKEEQGLFQWCIALFGTESMAREAGLSIEEYWQQIIDACFLNVEDPVVKWKEIFAQIEYTKDTLTNMKIESLHMQGEDVDLHVKIGANRKRLAGGGKNIPSFEIFTSPDRMGTNGWIRFSEPLYHYGTIIKGVELHFKDGIITKATAKENEEALLNMIVLENANKLGEFSLTDRRISRITKFMADTLFDENVGGEYGNTHVALGRAFKDCYDGDISEVSDQQWIDRGFNDSVVHTDMVSRTNRTVTAILADGSEKVIYKDGEFTI